MMSQPYDNFSTGTHFYPFYPCKPELFSHKWTGSDAIMLSVVVVGLSSFSEALMASFQINLQQPLVVHFLQSYQIRPIPRGETS